MSDKPLTFIWPNTIKLVLHYQALSEHKDHRGRPLKPHPWRAEEVLTFTDLSSASQFPSAFPRLRHSEDSHSIQSLKLKHSRTVARMRVGTGRIKRNEYEVHAELIKDVAAELVMDEGE